MKIICKFTDYYDSMQWVYGQDPLLIFDRRKKPGLPYYSDKYVSTIETVMGDSGYVRHFNYSIALSYCGVILRPVRTEKGYIYQKDKLFEYLDDKKYTQEAIERLDLGSRLGLRKDVNSEEELWEKLRGEPMPFSNSRVMDLHIETKQPILVLNEFRSDVVIEGIPNCSTLDLPSVIPAEKAWKDITEFFSRLKTMEEKDGNILEDDEKITSHGFDTVRSFRPKIKK